MKCVICHGENIRVADVRQEIILDNNVVYVPISVPVCASCGERYYDKNTMRYLEGVEGSLRKTNENLREVGKVFIYERVAGL
jgi:hypothetical protein